MIGDISQNVAFVFPGQGAQAMGMARDLLLKEQGVQDIFRRAQAVLGYDIADLCVNGPEDKLNSTEFSQPSIFVVSAACLYALQAGLIESPYRSVIPAFCAGLSLGEYTALYAAGAMSFEDGVRLVQLRGRAMQQAADGNPGAMVSILGLDEPAVRKLCDDARQQADQAGGTQNILEPVNFNCPGQIVISGTKPACQKAVDLADSAGAKAVPLRVAGAFHTPLMAPAADQLHIALEKTRFNPFKIPVIANVNALPYESSEAITQKLLDQLVCPVRWQQCVEFLINQGVTDFVEIGPGRVLAGLIKKISRQRKEKIILANLSA
jgi:[acyl-carrier-protein] S-malonyltransferase